MFANVPASYDSYYTQAFEWNGQYTVANSSVSVEAILTATETLANMLRHSPEIAARMAAGNSRFAIIPGNGTTKDIPEHSPFEARNGLGGTIGIPVASNTENNILKLPYAQNAYYNQNITIHEFAHSIENIGFDAALRSALTSAFNNAKNTGLWKGTYAETNEDEYFAEMTEAFFDTERESDNAKNHVNTRAELETYDPQGFAIMTRVYGNDSWRDGDWMGSKGNDNLVGLNTNDFMFGHDGADTIEGNGGNDTINGGAGVDTSMYSGEAKSFSVTITKGAATTVMDRSGAEGTDSLTDVEKLDFSGTKDVDLSILSGVVNVSSADLSAFIEVYIAYFNRAPDAEGLFYWGTRLSEGMSKEQIAKSFYVQPETQALYTNPDDTEGFVTAVYNNFLGRAPDDEGFAYWVKQLDDGAVSKSKFLLAIINGAKAETGSQTDVDYFTNKANIGAYFSVIKGMSDVANAKAAMALYDGSASSVTAAKNAIDGYYASALDANSGELLINLVGVMDDPFAV